MPDNWKPLDLTVDLSKFTPEDWWDDTDQDEMFVVVGSFDYYDDAREMFEADRDAWIGMDDE